MPCFHDSEKEGGNTNDEYFWQDLYVAQDIFNKNPVVHVDVGSRIDSFVAHVASFREICVFDIRPIKVDIPRVIFKQVDFMNVDDSMVDFCDSLSCLHTLEHFGLGRYGDPIRSDGYKLGLQNLGAVLKSGGVLYLSVPIGSERVEFNAHRIFDPIKLVDEAAKLNLFLTEFSFVEPHQKIKNSSMERVECDLKNLSKLSYSLGIFTFVNRK